MYRQTLKLFGARPIICFHSPARAKHKGKLTRRHFFNIKLLLKATGKLQRKDYKPLLVTNQEAGNGKMKPKRY